MIEKNVLRISPDGKRIEALLQAPEDYIFNHFHVRHYLDNSPSGWIDMSIFLGGTDNVESLSIPLSFVQQSTINAFGKRNTMLYVEVGYEWIGAGEPPSGIHDEKITYVCSDLGLFYFYGVDKILKMNRLDISNADYLFVEKVSCNMKWHELAMELGRFADAELFYKELVSLTSNPNYTFRDFDQSPYI